MPAVRRRAARSIRLASCAGTGEATSPAQPPFRGAADPMESGRPFSPRGPGRRASWRQPPVGSARSSGAHRLLPRRSAPAASRHSHQARGSEARGHPEEGSGDRTGEAERGKSSSRRSAGQREEEEKKEKKRNTTHTLALAKRGGSMQICSLQIANH